MPVQISKLKYSIFKDNSTTFYYNSLFFPPEVKKDVFDLYSFVRTLDNFVDAKEMNVDAYYHMKNDYLSVMRGLESEDSIVNGMVRLVKEKVIKKEWVESFFQSMEMDINHRVYYTLDELLEYIYGSAEVVGFMMAKIMKLPDESFEYASLLGRAFQHINFIRDIGEDFEIGRCYIPQEHLDKFGITSLDFNFTNKDAQKFRDLVEFEIDLFKSWQSDAAEGFDFIPSRLRIPILTANKMYSYTANKILQDPFVIYEKIVKPHKYLIIYYLINGFINEKFII